MGYLLEQFWFDLGVNIAQWRSEHWFHRLVDHSVILIVVGFWPPSKFIIPNKQVILGFLLFQRVDFRIVSLSVNQRRLWSNLFGLLWFSNVANFLRSQLSHLKRLNLCKLRKRKWNLPGQLALLVVEMVERFQHLVQRLHLAQEVFPLEPAGEHRNLVVGQNSFLDSWKNLNWRLDWAARWCCFARSRRRI